MNAFLKNHNSRINVLLFLIQYKNNDFSILYILILASHFTFKQSKQGFLTTVLFPQSSKKGTKNTLFSKFCRYYVCLLLWGGNCEKTSTRSRILFRHQLEHHSDKFQWPTARIIMQILNILGHLKKYTS